ncbi:hypothetical protein ACFYRY_15060 [Streptomyces sp. NPDC005263]|uniref:hypothetical protein n=1 Tax=Streptomyces sp. NPDC005263 TaxID=3364711 RepID=UPI0036B4A759
MQRHEFQPGRLVAGSFLTLAGVIYAGDAGGLWDTPWFVVIPLVGVGLFLAGAVGSLTRTLRRRRGAGRTEPARTPTDTPH